MTVKPNLRFKALAMVVVTMFAASACSSTTSTPSPSTAPAATPAPTSATSAAPTAAPTSSHKPVTISVGALRPGDTQEAVDALNVLINQFNPALLNAKNPFLNGFSIFGTISYPVTPLISMALAGIYNPSNRMYFIIPTFTFSLMNNLDLTLTSQTFQSYDPALYGSCQTMIFIRLKGSF